MGASRYIAVVFGSVCITLSISHNIRPIHGKSSNGSGVALAEALGKVTELGGKLRAMKVTDPEAADCLEVLQNFRNDEIEATKTRTTGRQAEHN